MRPCSVFPNNHRRATDHSCSPSPVPLSRLDTFPKSIHTRPDVPRLVIHDTDTTRMTTNRIVIVRDRKSLLPTKRPHFIQKLPHTNNVHSCYPDHIVLRFDCDETVACCLINNEKTAPPSIIICIPVALRLVSELPACQRRRMSLSNFPQTHSAYTLISSPLSP